MALPCYSRSPPLSLKCMVMGEDLGGKGKSMPVELEGRWPNRLRETASASPEEML